MSTRHLYADLERALSQLPADYAKIIKLSDKILKLVPNDPDALHVKFSALISQEAFALADSHFSIVQKLNSSLAKELVFEHAYLLYQQGNTKEALGLIRTTKSNIGEGKVEEKMIRQLELLEIQVLYKMEDYQACIEIYESLLEATSEEDPFYTELIVNYNAVKSYTQSASSSSEMSESIDTYEMSYNRACVKIQNGEINEAITLLLAARQKCREVLEQEEYEENDIESELAVIVTQLAYAYQLLHRDAEALDLYLGILKSRINNPLITAIASNNINSIKQEKDLFDSAKRHKVAVSGSEKFTLKQKKILELNGVILNLFMKQNTLAIAVVKKYIEENPNDPAGYLLQAGINYHINKKPAKTVEELQDYHQKFPSSVPITLTLVQIQITQSMFPNAILTLQSHLAKAQPTPLMTSIMLFLQSQSPSTLKESAWMNSLPTKNKQLAEFKLKSGRVKEAIKDFKDLYDDGNKDLGVLCGLVLGYVMEGDLEKAEKYFEGLKVLGKPVEEISASELDKIEIGIFATKKVSVAVSESTAEVQTKKIKPKKKRKPVVSKNFTYDPEFKPDQERWIPKRERQSYMQSLKKGKRREELNKGPQGAAVSGGGIGGTGSANIGGKKKEKEKEQLPVVEKVEVKEVVGSPVISSKSGKKKKGKK
ncbi:Signal recognition particle core component [Nowakowskiella sp. JEL0407]|nr:Signal recognition particle core component [Nowakowskiella sp. JEL0407]